MMQIFILFIFSFMLLSLPVAAYAQCTIIMDCVAASGIQGKRQSGLSREECERIKAQGASYSACTYTCSCTDSTGSSGQGITVPGLSAGDPLLDLSSQFLGALIGGMLSGGPDNAARQAEQTKQAAEIRRAIEEFKPVDFLGVEGFQEYHKRETERRNILERTTDPWCKLHPPLEPLRPIMPIPDDEYERMKAYYKARKMEFDQRCKEIEQASAAIPKETFCSGILCQEAGKKPRGTPGPLPISCSACWRNFDMESDACAGLETNIERLVCVNGALDKWTLCLGGCRSEPAEPVRVQ